MTDDTLRAAAQAVVDATANWHLPTTVGGARLSDALIALRSALAASATDEPVFRFDEANALRPAAPVALDVDRLARVKHRRAKHSNRLGGGRCRCWGEAFAEATEYAALSEQSDGR